MSERIVEVLSVVVQKPLMTVPEIATEMRQRGYEYHERTIRRDLQALANIKAIDEDELILMGTHKQPKKVFSASNKFKQVHRPTQRAAII